MTFSLSSFTPISSLTELLKHEEIDSVNLMGIHPGVLVQQSRPETVQIKAKELMELCRIHGMLDMIQCDGGVECCEMRVEARVHVVVPPLSL